ncbi:MAG TPA: LysM peptidoglycan-binding domain-containing protein [Candidatus Binataceae bacterium]|nr:LysM peptidoglycan-binding domain-containing protein [Candidatus Binataceae bacterium]
MAALLKINRVSRICVAVIFALAVAAPVLAQSGDFSEQNIPASGPPTAVRAAAAAPSVISAGSSSTASDYAPKPVLRPRATLPYTVRPGDTLGTVAQMFGLTPEQLAHSNRISPDEELISGDVLKVPNPFEAQAKSMQKQIDSLAAEAQSAEQRAQAAQRDLTAMQEKAQELGEDNQSLTSSLRLLPWWRATALSTIVAGALMFGVMIVTLFEWWRIRRRYVILANLSEDLGHLDYKYRAMLAKAELRLQQLYGRRRGGLTEGQPRPKMPEEVELERMAEELKAILEHHLVKLGARPRDGRKRARWREMIAEVDPRVEAPPVRR